MATVFTEEPDVAPISKEKKLGLIRRAPKLSKAKEELKQRQVEIKLGSAEVEVGLRRANQVFKPGSPGFVYNKIGMCTDLEALEQVVAEPDIQKVLQSPAAEYGRRYVVEQRALLNDASLTAIDFTDGRGGFSAKLGVALAHNTHVETLRLTRSSIKGQSAVSALAEALHSNASIKVLDVDDNILTPLDLVCLANAIAINQTLEEVRCTPKGRGKLEKPVLDAFLTAAKSNRSLCTLGLPAAVAGLRAEIDQQLMANAAARSTMVVVPIEFVAVPHVTIPCGPSYVEAVHIAAQVEFTREHIRAACSFIAVLPGRCWVIPNAVDPMLCDALVVGSKLDDVFRSRHRATLRSNNRREAVMSVDVAKSVQSSIPPELADIIAQSPPESEVRNVFERWRVSRYMQGDFFRAHVDDSYFRPVTNKYGESGETSSHTVLVCLSDDFTGGATRFWPSGRYDVAVDVLLPKGAVLIFEQHDLLHEGREVQLGNKWVAQTGLLRANGAATDGPRPVLFRWGPGLGGVA